MSRTPLSVIGDARRGLCGFKSVFRSSRPRTRPVRDLCSDCLSKPSPRRWLKGEAGSVGERSGSPGPAAVGVNSVRKVLLTSYARLRGVGVCGACVDGV